MTITTRKTLVDNKIEAKEPRKKDSPGSVQGLECSHSNVGVSSRFGGAYVDRQVTSPLGKVAVHDVARRLPPIMGTGTFLSTSLTLYVLVTLYQFQFDRTLCSPLYTRHAVILHIRHSWTNRK